MTPAEKTYLCRFRPLDVGQTLSQVRIAAWLDAALTTIHGPSDEARQAIAFLRRLGRAEAITQRHVCLDDYQTLDRSQWSLFQADGPHPWFRPTLERRLTLYQQVAEKAAAQAFPAEEERPDAVIQVTCTGYESPNAVQRVIARRGWGNDCHLLQLGHMGCYAAVPATRVAALSAREQGSCSVLHVELCSLHLDLTTVDLEQMVVHHLFADGAIRYDLATGARAAPARFELIDTFETLLPDSGDAMTWKLGGQGFRMTLDRDVPPTVARAVPGIVGQALARNGLYRSDVARWAIHPGGPRVITELAACLELDLKTVSHARQVLKTRGNMSSATLPHVWAALLADPEVKAGEIVVSLAFGPGLTVTGNILRKEC